MPRATALWLGLAACGAPRVSIEAPWKSDQAAVVLFRDARGETVGTPMLFAPDQSVLTRLEAPDPGVSMLAMAYSGAAPVPGTCGGVEVGGAGTPVGPPEAVWKSETLNETSAVELTAAPESVAPSLTAIGCPDVCPKLHDLQVFEWTGSDELHHFVYFGAGEAWLAGASGQFARLADGQLTPWQVDGLGTLDLSGLGWDGADTVFGVSPGGDYFQLSRSGDVRARTHVDLIFLELSVGLDGAAYALATDSQELVLVELTAGSTVTRTFPAPEVDAAAFRTIRKDLVFLGGRDRTLYSFAGSSWKREVGSDGALETVASDGETVILVVNHGDSFLREADGTWQSLGQTRPFVAHPQAVAIEPRVYLVAGEIGAAAFWQDGTWCAGESGDAVRALRGGWYDATERVAYFTSKYQETSSLTRVRVAPGLKVR